MPPWQAGTTVLCIISWRWVVGCHSPPPPPATPHTNRKYKDFTKHSFVFCSFHHCGFWAAISSSFVQIHMCLKKLQNILKMLVLLLRHVPTVTRCYGYDPARVAACGWPWPGPRHRPLITISVTSVGRCVAQ